MEAAGNAQTDFNEQRLIFKGRLDPSVNNRGYAGVTRVVRDGGSARMEGNTLVIENASSVMLLTRIEYFPDYSEEQGGSAAAGSGRTHPGLCGAAGAGAQGPVGNAQPRHRGFRRRCPNMDCLPRSFCRISGRARAIRALFSRRYSTCAATGSSSPAASIAACRPRPTPTSTCSSRPWPWAITAKARKPTSTGWRAWSRTSAPTPRTFSACAAPIIPSRRAKSGASKPCIDHAGSTATGETWPHPYWLAGGPWCVRPFWDHYLVTGDLDFLRKRVVPAYKDLALFYEDFLTVTDKDGNYIFVPSFSPENNPGNLNPSCMLAINASMDIAVCREVLANLVEACETARHRGRQRAEMEGDAGQAAALPARTGRRHEGMGLAHAGRALCSAAHLSSLRRLAGRRN